MKNISHTDISGNEQNFEILQIFPDARKYKTTYTTKYRNRKVWKKPDTAKKWSKLQNKTSPAGQFQKKAL